MKCCSLKRKDLDFHFKRMSEKFYMLNGLNDPNLKHVFLASLPQELQPEIQRMIASTRRDVAQLSLGEFHQMTFAALDKLCEQQSFFKGLMDKKALLKKACNKSYLEIQCKKKVCACTPKTPRIRKGGKTKKKSLRFFRRRPFRKKRTDRCYLCGKKGHFARRCPNKKRKSAKMVAQILQISETTLDDTDIESLYSEQDEQTEDTVFAIHDDSFKEEDEHSTVEEEDDTQPYLPIYMMQASSTLETAFQPTGATKTMLNPEVLPDDAWRTHYEYFKQLMARGFDLYHKAQRLQVLSTGVKYKRYFQPFSTIPRIFAIADAPAPYADIANQLKQCCADSHADFKHPHPLWKNPEFFIQLPFKLNEDANPIKASHPGMTPDDLALAREECSQLLELGLIEPTKSNGLPAFYVNIRTEQIRGKKSGQFKDSEKHYHAVYKEILAIKNGIKKFEFHLIGHHFTILMDNTSFPKIMDLKNKGVPEPQLLRLKDWFSKYQFTVKHIKGENNLIPDFLSRPSGIHLISPTGTIPIFMASSSSSTSRSPLTFPPKFFYDLKNIREYALDHMFLHLARLLAGTDIPQGRGCFRPDYPFLAILTLPGPGTGEAKPLPLYHQWRSLQKPLSEQKDEEQELARHLCFVNKLPFPAQRPRLVYTSLVIEPMDEDSDSDSIPEPDSQDPWDYGTEINLESPAASFHHGRPSASA
ncbi:UNVERIFIED_CONTAM: polyprotein [Sesamum latifolium]|uniref:Polyprotein n=1 Tax=Sesamum latifolium TaxID=2727402 RepID=A0AAW2S1S9_9LAMI